MDSMISRLNKAREAQKILESLQQTVAYWQEQVDGFAAEYAVMDHPLKVDGHSFTVAELLDKLAHAQASVNHITYERNDRQARAEQAGAQEKLNNIYRKSERALKEIL